jgi:hypothetical protein
MANNLESGQLVEVIAQLKSLNFSGDVIMDAIDDTNKLVARNILIGSETEGQRIDNGGQLLAVVTSMRRMVSEVSRSSKELLEFFTSNDMQEEEDRKDLIAALRARDKPRNTTRDTGKGLPSGLDSILVFAAGLVGGTVVGFVTETARLFGTLIKDTKIYKKISLVITKIGTLVSNGFNSIRTALTSLFNTVKLIGQSAVALVRESAIAKSITNTISQIAKSWHKFTGALRAIGDMIRPLFGAADEGLTIGRRLARMFPNIAKFFTSIGDIFGVFAQGFKTGISIGKGIARAIPKLFGVLKALAKPFVFVMAAFESIMGAIKGYKEGGVLGAVKGAISGFLIGLVGGLVDLVKDIVSWIANKLGFENFSKLLDSFSFSQLLKDGVDAIFDTVIYAFDWFKSIFSFEKFSKAFENFGLAGIWSTLAGGILDTLKGAVSWIATMFGAFDLAVALDNFSFTDTINKALAFVFDEIDKAINGLIDWIMNIPSLITQLTGRMGEAIGNAVSNAGSMAEGFAKSVLRDVLPDPAASGVLNPMSWVAKAIPDSIYEYAGLKAKAKEGEATGEGGGAMPAAKSLSDDQKSLKAKEAGYKSWDDYKSSGWKYKMPTVAPISNTTGAELMNSSNNISVTPVIVNNYGGNTNNTTQSSVNNSNSSYDPIMTGSAMGFASV